MSQTLLILRHEFLSLIRRKGFLILTLIFPVIGMGNLYEGLGALAHRPSI